MMNANVNSANPSIISHFSSLALFIKLSNTNIRCEKQYLPIELDFSALRTNVGVARVFLSNAMSACEGF